MLSPEANEILVREQNRTGESLVSIVNRAIVGLVALPGDTQTEKVAEQQPVQDLIREMDRKGRDEWQISKTLNHRGCPTFDDKDKWYPSTVRNFLNRTKSGS